MAKTQRRTRVIVERKGGFFGKIIAFLLGMVMGCVALIGGISAIVLYVLNKPVQETFDTVEGLGVDIPGDLLDYVNEDVATLSLLDTLTLVSQTATGIAGGTNTLGDLAALSPFLSENFTNWAGQLSGFGFPITEEEFLALSFPTVGEYLTGKLYSTSIASLINNFGSGVAGNNTLMCALLYGEKGVHYTVNEQGTAVALPLTYVFADNVFTDWDSKVFEKVGNEWVYENASFGTSTVIREYQVAPTSESQPTYSYEVYTIQGETQTLLYQLAQDQTNTSHYHAYVNGTIQMHTGLTIGSLLQGNDIMGTINNMQLFTLLNMNASTPDILLSLAGYTKDDDGNVVLKDGQSATTLNDLKGDKVTSIVNNMKIGEVLRLNASSDPIMLSLAYGNYTINNGVIVPEVVDGVEVDRTIADLTEENGGAQNIIQNLKLPVVLNLTSSSDPLMLKIAYGAGYSVDEHGNVTLDESLARSVADLTEGDFIQSLTIGDVIDTTGADVPYILKYLSTATIGGEGDNTITAKINDLRLVNAIGEEQCNSSTILSAMKDWKVNEFSTKVKELRLSQIIDTTSSDTPLILQSLADAKISGDDSDPDTIKNKVNALTLSQVIGEDKINGNFILKHLKGSTLTSMNDDIADLTVEDVFATDVYKTNADKKFLDKDGNIIDETVEGWESKRVLTGTWKYLLTDVNANSHPEKKHYLTDMASLVVNMKGNIQNASLNDLNNDGILELDTDILGKSLGGKKIGSFTIKDLVDALALFAS